MKDSGRSDGLQQLTSALRWLARIWSILSIAFVLAFVIGEGLSLAKLTQRDLSSFLFFPIGVCAGLLLAWWKEGLGGLLTVGSFVAFYLFHLHSTGRFPGGWAFGFVAAPGLLSLLCYLLSRRRSHVVT